jgi:hypothetical protein
MFVANDDQSTFPFFSGAAAGDFLTASHLVCRRPLKTKGKQQGGRTWLQT